MPLRDLRTLMPHKREMCKTQLASIIVRPRSFLLNIEPLQVIVTYNNLLVFNVDEDEQVFFQMLLELMERSNPYIFEQKALEIILTITSNKLKTQYLIFENKLPELLEQVTDTPTTSLLYQLRLMSDSIEQQSDYVGYILRELNKLLMHDEDMAMMYLSTTHKGLIQSVSDHDDIEMIIESSVDRLLEIENNLKTMKNRILNAEQFIQISAETERSQMIKMTLYVTLITLGLTASTSFFSAFGMNLISGYEHDPSMFYQVLNVALVIFTFLVSIGFYLIRKAPKTKKKF